MLATTTTYSYIAGLHGRCGNVAVTSALVAPQAFAQSKLNTFHCYCCYCYCFLFPFASDTLSYVNLCVSTHSLPPLAYQVAATSQVCSPCAFLFGFLGCSYICIIVLVANDSRQHIQHHLVIITTTTVSCHHSRIKS